MTLSGFDKVRQSEEVCTGMLMLTINILYTIMNFKEYKKLKDISCCFVDDKVRKSQEVGAGMMMLTR